MNPNEGDAYPLGALPKGTKVHCIEKMPGEGAHYILTAGSTATILRQVDDRVIIQLPSKLQVSLSKYCMASIGKLLLIIKLQFLINVNTNYHIRLNIHKVKFTYTPYITITVDYKILVYSIINVIT